MLAPYIYFESEITFMSSNFSLRVLRMLEVPDWWLLHGHGLHIIFNL